MTLEVEDQQPKLFSYSTTVQSPSSHKFICNKTDQKQNFDLQNNSIELNNKSNIIQDNNFLNSFLNKESAIYDSKDLQNSFFSDLGLKNCEKSHCSLSTIIKIESEEMNDSFGCTKLQYKRSPAKKIKSCLSSQNTNLSNKNINNKSADKSSSFKNSNKSNYFFESNLNVSSVIKNQLLSSFAIISDYETNTDSKTKLVFYNFIKNKNMC